MKKIVAFLLVITIIALCLTGCRDDKNETPLDNEMDNQQTEETTESQSPLAEDDEDQLIIVPDSETVGGEDLG